MKFIGFAVMVYVRGHYCGFYRCDWLFTAERWFDESSRNLGVLGCHYRVKPLWRIA